MLKVRSLQVGHLRSNCYLLFDDQSDKGLIIDPGDNADSIQNIISVLEIKPVALIATHGHFDHILAVNELKLAYQIPFLMNQNDQFLLSRMRSSAEHFTGYDPGPAPVIDLYLNKSEAFLRNDFSLEVLETPGHTPGCVCLYQKKEKLLFSGDTIFENGIIGRSDFSYSSPETLKDSIKKLKKLSNDVKVYSGHGGDFLLGDFFSNYRSDIL